MGNSDSLTDPMKLRSPLYPPVVPGPWDICKGLPCYPVWLPLRVDPDTPGVHLSVLTVIVRIDASAFLLLSGSRQLHFTSYEATYRFAFATTLRFACPTLWDFDRELSASGYPLHLPLLRRWTVQFPRLDFNQQVIRYTRHTITWCNLQIWLFSQFLTNIFSDFKDSSVLSMKLSLSGY